MKKIILFSVLFFLAACGSYQSIIEDEAKTKGQRPNVLLILVDDMGFADLSSFGSEIPTPHLDDLAQNGVKFSQLITSSVCSPTRASLLTGVSPHLTGLGNLAEELAPNQIGQPGYEGYLNDRVVTIATLLQDNGYHTMMTGKWHLGKTPDTYPYARGFNQTFGMLTNASHFSDMKPAYSPNPNAKAHYTKNGQRLTALPDSFDYSSQFYVDELIRQIDTAGKDQPFFGFLSFSAPHWPIQAPQATIDQFIDEYIVGYDVIAQQRLEKQISLGLLPTDTQLAPRPPKGRPWTSLSRDEKRIEAKSMAIYAAMIKEVDDHTGRLIEYLKQTEQFANTVIIFMSDNGPEGHDLDETWSKEAFSKIRKVIDESNDFSYENMGLENSYTFYGPNWAWASSPGFASHKAFQSEGGIRTAGFVYAPQFIEQRGVSGDMFTVKDIAATILAFANVAHPGTTYRDKPIFPLEGESIIPVINGERSSEPKIHIDETMGKISVRKGHWKLVKMPPPHGSGQWDLFNLDKDLGERVNLVDSHPDVSLELIQNWESYKNKNNIVLPNWVSGY